MPKEKSIIELVDLVLGDPQGDVEGHDGYICCNCKGDYHVEFGCEPTSFCNDCAQVLMYKFAEVIKKIECAAIVENSLATLFKDTCAHFPK